MMENARKLSRNFSKAMIIYILEGHSEIETAEEFGCSVNTVRHRINSMGYTFDDLINLRKKCKKRS